MTTRALNVLEDALHLNTDDRADLVAQLIDSLDTTEEADVEAAWEKEIQRRIADLDSGRVQTIPWSRAREIIAGSSDESSD